MKKAVFAVLASLLLAAMAMASPVEVLKPIHQFIDGFNKGDTASGFAAYATAGDIVIIDEFTPHIWSGRDAAHQWAADYDKHSKAKGKMAFVLRKEPAGWKIAAWTWTGTKPQAAK